jgi:hypothetical protein
MRLYRSMRAAPDGLPEVGPFARGLGVRPGIDFPAMLPTDLTGPGGGGMSVAPDDPMNLARVRRPPAFGGTGRDPIWYIEVDDLGPGLVVRPDTAAHALVEPAGPVTVDEFQRLLAATRDRWVLATP